MRREATERYISWIFIFVSSFVVLLSSGQEFFNRIWAKGAFKSYEGFDVNTSQTQTILILVICSVSLISSFLAVMIKTQPALRLGILGKHKIEVLTSLALFILWTVAIIIIQAPKYNLAVSPICHATFIRNSNLYFSSWAALLANVYNLMEILEEHKVTNVKLMVDMMPKEMFSWTLQFVVGILLLLFSVTALGISCSKDCTFCPPKVKEIQCPLIDDPDRNCYSKRMCWSAYFAVSIAAISILISMGAISAATRGIILPTADILLGSIAMSFNLTGIVVLTSIGGPSFSCGNNYFLLWIGFLNTLRITSVACYEFVNKREEKKIAKSFNPTDNCDELKRYLDPKIIDLDDISCNTI